MRLRIWEYRQLPVMHKWTRPSRPDKARRLGFKKKAGYVIYRIRIIRGNRTRQAHDGRLMGKPKNIGILKIKYAKSL